MIRFRPAAFRLRINAVKNNMAFTLEVYERHRTKEQDKGRKTGVLRSEDEAGEQERKEVGRGLLAEAISNLRRIY